MFVYNIFHISGVTDCAGSGGFISSVGCSISGLGLWSFGDVVGTESGLKLWSLGADAQLFVASSEELMKMTVINVAHVAVVIFVK